MSPPRVILNCDTANEVDDQFAIAHALGLPDGTLDVLGVVSVHNTTAHGPASRDMYQDEAERIAALCGGGTPCITGAERPMESRGEPAPSAGLDFMIDEARQGPLTVICTGPATDAASLILAAPEVRENVRVVWLGGFGDAQSYERYKMGGELNGRADIAAWRTLLEEPVNLLHVPCWPGPAKLVVDAGYAEELRGLGRPIADYLAEILVRCISEYGGEAEGGQKKILWDISSIAALADPDAVTIEPLAVPTLDAAGANDFSQRGRTVEALVDLDEGSVLDGLQAALSRLPANPGTGPKARRARRS